MNALRNLVLSVFFPLGGMMAANAYAGCSEGVDICSRYENNKLVDASKCKITMCSNTSFSTLDIKWRGKIISYSYDAVKDKESLNGKPVFSTQKGNLSCFGFLSNKNEIFCVPSEWR